MRGGCAVNGSPWRSAGASAAATVSMLLAAGSGHHVLVMDAAADDDALEVALSDVVVDNMAVTVR